MFPLRSHLLTSLCLCDPAFQTEQHRRVAAQSRGLGVKTTVHIVSAANQYRNNLATGEQVV
jgi:hypothetical protein